MKKKKLLYNPVKDDFEYLDPSDQLEYNKTLGTFRKGNKTGALSDFKEEYKKTKLFKYIDDVKAGDTKKYEKAEQRLFEPILKNLQIKAKREAKRKVVKPAAAPALPPIVYPEIDLEISKKNLRDEYLEKQFKELTKERPDPDLQNGLGSIVYKLNKD